MSTAILNQSSFYDFGDIVLKNQGVCNEQTQQTHMALTRARSLGTPSPGSAVIYQQSSPPPPSTPKSIMIQNALVKASNILHRRLERAVSEPMPTQIQSQQQQPRYKTELCRPFEEAGSCKYGDKCQFAHGIGELRNLQRHPKYKTELCRTFHSVGFCPYGPRCHFVHNADEARSRPSLPPSPVGSSSLSRSPADSVSSFFPNSPPQSPRTPSPSLLTDEARLPVFNRLSSFIMDMRDMAIA